MEFAKHFQLNSMLQYITVILFLVSITVKADITPLKNPVYFDSRDKSALLLSCKATGEAEIVWKKNGTDVRQIPALNGRYEIKDRNTNFIIKVTEDSDDGNYSCSSGTDEAPIEVIANVWLKKIPNHMSIVEGESLTIHCKAFGTDPEITWTVGDNKDFNRSRIVLKDDNNVKDAILFIENSVLEDRSFYNCTARNKATGQKGPDNVVYTEAMEDTYVRVKGKLAALWPFLGICAEVIILCAIILVYEKRRNKEGLDESDTDQSPEQEKLKTGK